MGRHIGRITGALLDEEHDRFRRYGSWIFTGRISASHFRYHDAASELVRAIVRGERRVPNGEEDCLEKRQEASGDDPFL